MREYTLYLLADVISRIVPQRPAYWIALRLADFFFWRDAKGRAAVMANLRRVLEFSGQVVSDDVLSRMARQTFRYFGKYLVDFFRFSRISEKRIHELVRIENMDNFLQARAMRKGVIMVSAHFGNWELGGCVLETLGHHLNAVALRQPVEKVNRLFQNYRRKRGVSVIPLGSSARHLLRLLRENQIVVLLADRGYGRRGAAVDFFGAPAALPRGPAWLAVKSGAPVVPAFVIRRDDDGFVLRFHPPIMPGADRDAEAVQSRICRVMEEEIARRPCQWLMFQDLWDGRSYAEVGGISPGPEEEI